jgi:chemotaxis protein MotB
MEVHMNKLIVRTGLIGLLSAAALGLGGCNGGVKEENAALREQNATLTSKNEEFQKTVTESESRRNEAEGKAAQKDAEIARLQTELATKSTPQNFPNTPNDFNKGKGTTGGSERIVVAGDVLFGPGSASLTSGGKKEIDTVISTIKNRHQGDTIRVEGYTDSDPIKKSSYGSNQALSQARAESVEKYMASKGISASRISAVGMGAKNPKSSKSASRRVEIVIVDTN